MTFKTRVSAIGLLCGLMSGTVHAQHTVNQDFGVSYRLNVEEAITFSIDGDIMLNLDGGSNWIGSENACLGLNFGNSFEVSLNGANRPQNAEYFYLQGAGDNYLRYQLYVLARGENASNYEIWQYRKSGEVLQITLPEQYTDDTSDVCGDEVLLAVGGRVDKHQYSRNDSEGYLGDNVFLTVDALTAALPAGDYLFNDTVTIILSPVLS